MREIKEKYFMPIVWSTLILSAVIVITLCSKCSPLYPLNDWDDPNCFLTVGRSVCHGNVLYRDIFEQKGPILYFLHSLACLISERSFIGIYFAELIAAVIFLFYSFKTAELFIGKKAVWVIPLTACTVYGSYSFQGGDSAEELLLPFAAFTLYTALYTAKERKMIPPLTSVLTGISIGIALWIKFTLLGVFMGFVLAFVILYIKKRKIKDIFLTALLMTTGLLLCSAPVIIYFICSDSLGYLYEVYIYDNLFLYGTGGGIPVIGAVINLLAGAFVLLMNHPLCFVFTVLGLIYIIRTADRRTKLIYLIIFAVTFFFTYTGGRFYAYYALILSIFIPVGAAALIKHCHCSGESDNKKTGIMRIVTNTAYIAALIVGIVFCPNFSRLGKSADEYPQFRFDKYISQKENASLLNYGFLDGGFYTVSGIVPDCRFFCTLNIPYDEMYDVQNEYIARGLADFIVTKDSRPVFPGYKCIDECEFPYGTGISKYCLYINVQCTMNCNSGSFGRFSL